MPPITTPVSISLDDFQAPKITHPHPDRKKIQKQKEKKKKKKKKKTLSRNRTLCSVFAVVYQTTVEIIILKNKNNPFQIA